MSKTLDRIAGLLAQAESTEFEEERDAFIQKAQSLASYAAIDLEVARKHQRDRNKRETPTQKHFIISGTGYSGRSPKSSAALCSLIIALAHANDVRLTLAHNSTYVNLFGFPSDIEVVLALYGSLSLQMLSAADAGIKAGKHKEEQYFSETTGTYRSDARVWRTGFYSGFTAAISARLQEAKREAEEHKVTLVSESGQEESTTGALVLVGKREEVETFYTKARGRVRGSYRGGGQTRSGVGLRAGATAGRSANLGTGGRIGTRTALAS